MEGDHLWHNSTPLAELGRAPGVREYAREQITQAKNHAPQSMTWSNCSRPNKGLPSGSER
jgi:hypothetical protein